MQWTLSTRWARPGQWGDYVLVINASKYIDMQFEEGPCWRQTNIHVYQIDNIHQHSYCMRHCQKIDNGRVPSVVSLAQWEAFKVEIEAVSPHTCSHCHLWMSATHLAPGPHTNRANNVKWRSSFFGDFWSNFNDGENLRNSFVLLRSSFLVLRNSFLLNQITLKSQDLISGPYTKKELRDFETQMNYKKKLCMEIKL